MSATRGGLAPVPGVLGLAPYRPPVAGAPHELKLDANEGPPLSEPELREALAEITVRALHRYPSAGGLEAALAARWNVAPERVLVTAGGDDALARICQAFLAPGRQALLTRPSFEMIARYARLSGAEVEAVPWLSGPLPTAELCARLPAAPAVVFVVTPNNPTGAWAAPEDLSQLSAAAEATGAPGALLVVDLAYTEFADFDLTPLALSLPNVVVVRTFSKAWSLAGLRVGYALGPPPVMECLRAVGQPFAVSGPGLLLATHWLQNGLARLAERVARVREERFRLTELLSRLGARPLPSQANFVLADFADAPRTADMLADCGIAVRRFTGPEELRTMLRITLPGERAGFERLAGALELALSGPPARPLEVRGGAAQLNLSQTGRPTS